MFLNSDKLNSESFRDEKFNNLMARVFILVV